MSSAELDRLKRLEAAARTYIAAQIACWEHRRNLPDDLKAMVYWIAERDNLAEQSDQSLAALAALVGDHQL